MAAPVVQSASASVSTASTSSFQIALSGVTAGNSLLLIFSFAPHASGSAPTISISDSAGGTWANIVTATGPDSTNYYQGVTAWRLAGAAAGTHTLTVTMSGQTIDGASAHLMELPAGSFSSGGANTAINVTSLSTASGTPASSATAFAAITNVGSSTNEGFTDPPSGWTSQYAQQNGATVAPYAPIEICLKNGVTGATSTSWSWTTGVHTGYALLVFFIASAGGGAALAAASSASGSSAAALTTSIRFAAAPSASGGSTAALTAGIRMAASQSASSSSSAALTTSIRLAAASSASGGSTAALTASPGIGLQASSSASGSSTAALTTSIRIAATSSCLAGSTAALTTGIRLASSALAAASSSSILTTQIRLAAQSSAMPTSTATLLLPVYTPSPARMSSPTRSVRFASVSRDLSYSRPTLTLTSPARDSTVVSPDRII